MFSMDVTYHATQDLIYTLQNPELTSPLVEFGHVHNETLNTLAETFKN